MRKLSHRNITQFIVNAILIIGMISETGAKAQMPIWIINDTPPSVWENQSSACVSQSVFPDESHKPVLRTQMNGKARDGQEMTKVRKWRCWQIGMAPLLLFFPGGSVLCFLSEKQSQRRLFQSEGFSIFHLRERVRSLLYNLFSALGLSWPSHWEFTPKGDERVILRAVSLPSSLPLCLSLLPHPFFQIHTHPNYSYTFWGHRSWSLSEKDKTL